METEEETRENITKVSFARKVENLYPTPDVLRIKRWPTFLALLKNALLKNALPLLFFEKFPRCFSPYLPELELGGRASFFFFFSHRGPPHLIVAVRDRNKTLVITTVLAFLVSREFFFSLLGQRRNFEI